MTDTELRHAVLVEQLKKLRDQRRKREEKQWQRRIDDALERRGYPRQRRR